MFNRSPTIQATLNARTFWFVSSVEAYRPIAGSWPTQDDVVWELGAATGAATKLVAAIAREVYAVEKAPEKLAKLAELAAVTDNVHIVEADALDPQAVPEGVHADWLLVDVGGDAPPWRTMELAERWAAALDCARVVVRNTALASFLTSAAPIDSSANAGTVASLNEAAGRDPTLLVQPILDAASREIARRLVSGLAEAGFKARQRLVEGLVCLGPTAMRPLARLVNDTEAPVAARRAAADAVRQIAIRIDRDVHRAGRNATPAMEWALGVGEGLGAQLARADREGTPPPADALLSALGHPDELVQFVARQSLRAGGMAIAEELVRAAAQSSFVAPTVSALDALTDLKAASAEQVVKWYLPWGKREGAPWRLAAATLGVSDQRWAGAIHSAIERVLPKQATEALRSLIRAAQTKPRGRDATHALNELIGAPAPISLLATGASLSPHPWMRELADVMAEAIAEEE